MVFKFELDLAKQALKIIQKENVKCELKSKCEQNWTTDDINKLLLQYMDLSNRRIKPVKRNVHYSKGLINSMNLKTFKDEVGNVVEKDESLKVINLIGYFEGCFKKGLDVNNHLSRSIYNLKFKDKLLNTWNIKHIHLSDYEAQNNTQMKKIVQNGYFFVL